MKLSEEQFEDALRGRMPEHADLDEAERNRLEEARAVRDRLRGAFASVRAGDELAARVRSQWREPRGAESAPPQARRRAVRLVWRLAPAAVAAAALIVVALILFPVGGPRAVTAATTELVRIHTDNLAAGPDFHHQSDPDQVAAHFERELGFAPVVLKNDEKTKLVGSCVAKFRDEAVASYVVTTDRDKVTIVVVQQRPKELGLQCRCDRQDCRCFHCGDSTGCNIAAVRIGGRSYCAVGRMSHDALTAVLARLLPERER